MHRVVCVVLFNIFTTYLHYNTINTPFFISDNTLGNMYLCVSEYIVEIVDICIDLPYI